MKLNVASTQFTTVTHEGGPAIEVGPEKELRRAVSACLLWEDGFYESGQEIGNRIAALVAKVRPEAVAEIAIDARGRMKLRHVPLLLCREMARLPDHKRFVGSTLASCIQRADEITEFLAIYWAGGRQPISKQVKKALRAAFLKFDEYQLAKYDRDGKVKLRDAFMLVHGKTRDTLTEDGTLTPGLVKKNYVRGPVVRHSGSLSHKLMKRELKVPDTWEVALSTGADKRGTFERLMAEKNLGALAFLRNLRGMIEAGVDRSAIEAYGAEVKVDRVLPFRLIAAAKHAPSLEPMIYGMLVRLCAGQPRFHGTTVLLVDGSGSMGQVLSGKSEMTRREAAIALAMVFAERCDRFYCVAFSSDPWEIPPRKGFGMRDAINAKVVPESTMLGKAVRFAQEKHKGADRVVVITDEQSHDKPPHPERRGYVINVSSARPSIAYGPWVGIDGWSEGVLEYVSETERDA